MAKNFNLNEFLQGLQQQGWGETQQRYAITNFRNQRKQEYGKTVDSQIKTKLVPSFVQQFTQQNGFAPNAQQLQQFTQQATQFYTQQFDIAFDKKLSSITPLKPISNETYQANTQAPTQNPLINAGSAFKTGLLGVNPARQTQLGGNQAVNTVASLAGSAARGLGVGAIGAGLGALASPFTGGASIPFAASLASGIDSGTQNIQQQQANIQQGKQPNVEYQSAIAQGAFDALPLHLGKNPLTQIATQGVQEGASQVIANLLNSYNANPLEGLGESVAGGAGVEAGMLALQALLGKYGRNLNTGTIPTSEPLALDNLMSQLQSLNPNEKLQVLSDVETQYGKEVAGVLSDKIDTPSNVVNLPYAPSPYQGEVSVKAEAPPPAEPTADATALINAVTPTNAQTALASAPDALNAIATMLNQPTQQQTQPIQPTQSTTLQPQSITVTPPPQTIEAPTVDVQNTASLAQQTPIVPELAPQIQNPLETLGINTSGEKNNPLKKAENSPISEATQGVNPPVFEQAINTPSQQENAPNESVVTDVSNLQQQLKQEFNLNDEQAKKLVETYFPTNSTVAQPNKNIPNKQLPKFQTREKLPVTDALLQSQNKPLLPDEFNGLPEPIEKKQKNTPDIIATQAKANQDTLAIKTVQQRLQDYGYTVNDKTLKDGTVDHRVKSPTGVTYSLYGVNGKVYANSNKAEGGKTRTLYKHLAGDQVLRDGLKEVETASMTELLEIAGYRVRKRHNPKQGRMQHLAGLKEFNPYENLSHHENRDLAQQAFDRILKMPAGERLKIYHRLGVTDRSGEKVAKMVADREKGNELPEIKTTKENEVANEKAFIEETAQATESTFDKAIVGKNREDVQLAEEGYVDQPRLDLAVTALNQSDLNTLLDNRPDDLDTPNATLWAMNLSLKFAQMDTNSIQSTLNTLSDAEKTLIERVLGCG